MIPPDPSVRDGKAFSALLNELAPDPSQLTEVQRLEVLDRAIAALVMIEDGDLRELYLELAINVLHLGKRLGNHRLAAALVSYRQFQAAEAARALAAAAAAAPRVPGIERLRTAVAEAVPGFEYLLRVTAPSPGLLDDPGKLKALDQVIAALLPMPDQQLAELYRDRAGEYLELPPRLVKARWKVAQSAPTAPAGQGGDAGGTELDGGFHRMVIATMRRWLAANNLRPDAVAGWLGAGDEPAEVKPRELVNAFFFQHASFFESLPRDRIDITLAAMSVEGRHARRREILSWVTGKPATAAGRDELRKWLVATTHRDDPTDFAVMLHWIWQVKRLNTRKPVAWDLMPILVGRQGDGKSTAIELLIAAWKELAIPIDAEKLTDDRSSEVLGDYAIGFWGEMAGGNKAEVARLKSTLTSRGKIYRELGGHHHNRIVRRMAFIGDSNNKIADVIQDPTGARRFYEIKVNGFTDRATLNAIDAVLCWQAVSEDDPPPYDEVADEVRLRQKDLVHRDSFDLFVDWCDSEDWQQLVVSLDDLPPGQNAARPTLTIPAYSDERGYTLFELGVLFRHYCRHCGQTIRGDQWLARRLGEAGWVAWKPSAGLPKGAKRPLHYRKPLAPPEPMELAGPPAPTRGQKLEAPPSPAEDLFNREPSAPMREPGDDETEPPWTEEDHDAIPP